MEKSIFTDEYKQVIDDLIAARLSKELNQIDIAKKLRTHQSFISKYEQRQRRLDVVEFVKICEIMGVDPCTIIKAIKRATITAW